MGAGIRALGGCSESEAQVDARSIPQEEKQGCARAVAQKEGAAQLGAWHSGWTKQAGRRPAELESGPRLRVPRPEAESAAITGGGRSGTRVDTAGSGSPVPHSEPQNKRKLCGKVASALRPDESSGAEAAFDDENGLRE